MAQIIERGRKVIIPTKANSCQKGSLRLFPRRQRREGSFQKAGRAAFVYSAHHDPRPNAKTQHTFIRIIGVSVPNAHLYCHVWYRMDEDGKRDIHIVEAYIHQDRLHSQ